jgi:3'(2'), 5'-bisphosphate nucleotidase
MLNNQLIDAVIAISKNAGEAILEIYNSDFDYEIKEDLSPLTEADKISHRVICQMLKSLTPNLPILSEEDSSIPYSLRSKWNKYWLIDPLDGTKEFIKRNGEFTVNIALIENHSPILGVIHIPVSGETYWGSYVDGSYYSQKNKTPKKINVSEKKDDPIRVVASRSHYSKALDYILDEIGNFEIITKGSSLKFCLIANGEADIYPRIGLTSEWDIAAGEAIVKYSGGYMLDIDGNHLRYNHKKDFLNPYFIASNDKKKLESLLLTIKSFRENNSF